MKLTLGAVSPRRSKLKSAPAEMLVQDFIARSARLCPVDSVTYATEEALLEATERQPARQPALLLLFDSRGENLSSDEFARLLGRLRDDGTQRVLLGIGPADGWSAATLARAHRTLSFGRITLPHELARVVLAEQVYRALTILAGHPYHSGH